MDLMLLRIFQSQVLLQCRHVIASASQLNAGLKDQDTLQIFFGVQNLLTASANIAKAVWGSGNGAEKRAEARKPLRDSIGITDDSPLRQVKIRTRFEHLDEYLDRWWSREGGSHHYVDCNVGSVSEIYAGDPQNVFRHFDPETLNVVFWGETFDVQAIVREVERLIPILERETTKPFWEN